MKYLCNTLDRRYSSIKPPVERFGNIGFFFRDIVREFRSPVVTVLGILFATQIFHFSVGMISQMIDGQFETYVCAVNRVDESNERTKKSSVIPSLPLISLISHI